MNVNNAINTDLKNMFARFQDKLFFESSQIHFYLCHIPLSCITIIKIKKMNISKRFSISPCVLGS